MCFLFFFFKQKTAYEMRISDWSSDVCSSDLGRQVHDERRDLLGLGASTQGRTRRRAARRLVVVHRRVDATGTDRVDADVVGGEIGRASGRGRVCQYV